MSRPIPQCHRPDPRFAATTALGPADPRTLALAAEILRERTMSLDPDESEPARRLVLMAIGATVIVALAIIAFRHQLRWALAQVT